MAVTKDLMVNHEEYKRRIALPLFDKIQWTIERYIDFVEVYEKEGVYIAFSGGKDSQTLSDIIDRLHAGEMMEYLRLEYVTMYKLFVQGKPAPPKAFCDTGLEFPEIRKHVLKFGNVTRLTPKKKWKDVVKEYGFLIGSKKVSRMIADLRNPTERNAASRNLYLTGMKRDGTNSKNFKLPKAWRKLINAPFNVSSKCCDIFKKEPFKIYEKETGRMPIAATTAQESDMRRISYLQTGCNSFGNKDGYSRPFSIWGDNDVWAYHDKYGLRFAEVYYERTIGKIVVEPELRTGCMFCLIGQPKDIERRFDRLEVTHPSQFAILMEAIGIRTVFDWIGIQRKLF